MTDTVAEKREKLLQEWRDKRDLCTQAFMRYQLKGCSPENAARMELMRKMFNDFAMFIDALENSQEGGDNLAIAGVMEVGRGEDDP